MLKRIYIDNFRCLVNFELSVDGINLFLGPNGTGKSAIFDVLGKIQSFVSGEGKVNAIFNADDCTCWQTSPIQSFELEIAGNEGIYKYELSLEQNRENNHAFVRQERLCFDNQPLLNFESGEVTLYHENGNILQQFSLNGVQSVLPLLNSRSETIKLNGFKERIDRFIIVRINPTLMVDNSEGEETHLSPSMENFVSWYRYLSQNQGKIIQLTHELKEIFDGFSYFEFADAGLPNKILKLYFSRAGDREEYIAYRFGKLSDGQRVLIALYTLIYCTQSEDYTLCIDEPENFLALPEIQPWLMQFYDFCSEGKTQALLISHHPILIDYLLASPVGYWFDRQQNSPVRVKRISNDNDNDTGLPISELVARGWIYESA
ncbi:MAG: AAA family ATPase [Hormoscilla sp. GM7CHS1pb]|nr:AAA family ATPase [Hormoscilla sp. GM7CHS1pb]